MMGNIRILKRILIFLIIYLVIISIVAVSLLKKLNLVSTNNNEANYPTYQSYQLLDNNDFPLNEGKYGSPRLDCVLINNKLYEFNRNIIQSFNQIKVEKSEDNTYEIILPTSGIEYWKSNLDSKYLLSEEIVFATKTLDGEIMDGGYQCVSIIKLKLDDEVKNFLIRYISFTGYKDIPKQEDVGFDDGKVLGQLKIVIN